MEAMVKNQRQETMIERLERALVLSAYTVARHGTTYAAYIDRLERELKIARRDDAIERSWRILRTYSLKHYVNVRRILGAQLR